MTQTLDPLVSLAFSLRASPGVHALLLGSGVSRSAGIPTGWEVVLDLIRRVAAAQGEKPGDEPEKWYAERYGKEAGYSDLLDALCQTRIERQQLLKGYFEPTKEEREQGLKLPTPAHHAVAELMEAGLVRVVITTNFDRLLEQALERRGIVPIVIGSADQVAGMIPLTHQKHCIIKVHGDYLDTRILNTEEELSAYDPLMTALVDRVFDEFGLLVCGWSATWDAALRGSIERATNRRYSCFWTTMGDLSEEAKAVVAGRRADVISIKSADSLFEKLLARVRGLEEFEQPHPLSVQAAVGAAKRYLVDDSGRIRLHDLYRDVVADAKAVWAGPTFAAYGDPAPSVETITARVKAYDASATTVVALNTTIARWSRGEQDDMLVDAISEVGREPFTNGSQYAAWADLRGYPGTRMLYSAGMASLIAKRPALLNRLMTVRTPTINDQDAIAASHLSAPMRGNPQLFWGLFGGARRHVPMSDWLHDSLREQFQSIIADEGDYDLLFDTFEYYLALAHVGSAQSLSGWVPVGSWGYREKGRQRIVAALTQTDARFGGQVFAASCDAFVRNGKPIEENIEVVEAFRRKLPFY